MMRHVLTLVLSGILGSIVLSGNAEACHKKRCGCVASRVYVAPAPVVCPQPVAQVQAVQYVQPAPCVRPVACAPRPKKCGGFLSGLCHKRRAITVACAAPVSYGAPAAYGPYVASPQASAQ